MGLRVISGERKGHKLIAPKGKDVRPTEDRIKENLFNILSPLKPEAIILDLFGGSGAIGIEFLSRGANKAYIVDLSPSSIEIIRENLVKTRLIERSMIINKDATRALDYLKSMNIKLDYIYLDPPFKNHELLFKVIHMISSLELLRQEGKLIVEHETDLLLGDEIVNLEKYDSRKYGSKTLSFYRMREVL